MMIIFFPFFEDSSLYLTRFITEQPVKSFNQPIKTNLITLTMKYKSFCVAGFTLEFIDQKSANVGIEGSETVTLDLFGNRRLYSFESWCDLVCEYIKVCSIDMTSMIIDCVSGGNVSTEVINISKFNYVNLEALNLKSLFGTMNNEWSCISNLGVGYTLSNYSKNDEKSVLNLVYGGIRLENVNVLNFTQKTTTSKRFKLKNLIINFDSVCATGFTFEYSDGTRESTGSFGKDSVKLDLTSRKTLYSVHSNCDVICNFLRFCSIEEKTLKVECVDAGDSEIMPDYFVSTKHFQIDSFYGDNLWYNGSNCLRNLGIKYKILS
jgi:hypothetical protein